MSKQSYWGVQEGDGSQRLKITLLVSKKRLLRWGEGEGEEEGKGMLVKVVVSTSGRKRVYYWMSELTFSSGTADIHISIPSCVLSVLISADQNPKLFHYCNTNVPAHA